MASRDDALWDELGRTFKQRPGWGLQPSSTPGAPPAWCFGKGGENDLMVSVDSGRVYVYVMETDRDFLFDTVEDLTRWLDANEAAALQGPLQAGEILDDLVHGRVVPWEQKDL
ncbi:MAG TPA: hypothetical protein VK277_10515 [Acidimicrobiales bacterium]|nr:hypothetical protein [Acidimicrobiales bacterium]